MSFVNGNFVSDRATRDALGHTDVVKLARAMLSDEDPAVRRAAASHLATSTSEEVRRMVRASTVKKSRTEASPSLNGSSRADRVAKSASARQDAKAESSGAGGVRRTRPGNLSRFAHLANFAGFKAGSTAAEIEAEAVAQHVPGLRQPLNRSAISRELAAAPSFATAEAAAAAMMSTMRKLQGKEPATASRAAQHDLNTQAGLAAHAVTAARRAGVVR